MKTLTAGTTVEKNAQGNVPVTLVEIDWTDSYTQYIADCLISIEGQTYDDALVNTGKILQQLARPDVGDIFIEIRNDEQYRTSNLILKWDPEKKIVIRVRQFFDGAGLGTSDIVELFKGIIESPSHGLQLDDQKIRLNAISYEHFFDEFNLFLD